MAVKTQRICGICGTECSGPGKFEGNKCQVVARALYAVTMDSGQDDEIGESDGPMGWHALIIGSVPEDTDKSAAYLVNGDSNGFFGYTAYDTEAEARSDWSKLVAEYDALTSEEEEETLDAN